MNKYRMPLLLLLALLITPGGVFAAEFVLSGTFSGKEDSIAPMPSTCAQNEALPYLVAGPVTVSASGGYTIIDGFNWMDGQFNKGAVDIALNIYSGSFDPANPSANRVFAPGIDIAATVQLNVGTDYLLVVQPWCAPVQKQGTWAVGMVGNGQVTSSLVRNVPAYTSGSFTNSDPSAELVCNTNRYVASAPIQVATSGKYYYTDLSIEYAADICLSIYKGSFDPANPFNNWVDTLDDAGVFTLEANTDYILVSQLLEGNGDYFFLLAPPAPFRVTSNLSGSWYNPATSGQGLFLDVFDESQLMFAAWFTFDLERPAEGTASMVGGPGQRWLTAQGEITGTSSTLGLYKTTGMVLDSADPPGTTVEDGSMTLTFDSCVSGQVDYDLGSANTTGSFPISRLSAENEQVCQDSYEGAGLPGPL